MRLLIKPFLFISFISFFLFSPLFNFSVKAQESVAPTALEAPAPNPVSVADTIPDPSGANTGGLSDVPAASAGKPTVEEVAAVAGHNKISINFVWVLLAGFLVMFMQCGFAMVETGFTRAKNVAHTMVMNFAVYAFGMLGFWICGFAFMFGGFGAILPLGGQNLLDHEVTINLFGKAFDIIGMKGFFLSGTAYDVTVVTLFLFQMVFMDTAATIPTGAMAERWRFISFVIFSFFISMISYPIHGNWVWGGGWLADLGVNFGLGHGVVDFAGSGVVHMVGGWTALAGAIVLGARIGKYGKDGTVNAIPGHNIPMAVAGTLVLGFGWFGFNAGSTLAGTDLRIGIVAVNTMLASASGTFVAMIYMWVKYGKPDPSMMVNGMLAGLVAITAPCAFVTPIVSVIIGAIASLLIIWSVFFIDQTLKIDDPVGAISVHGVGGAWGILSLGLFADGTYGDGWNGVKGPVTGLFYGDSGQLIAQIIEIFVCFTFIFSISYLFFKVLDKLVGNRVSAEMEIEGLDIPEMGVRGYQDSIEGQR
ncbi:MAG: ammonium transporter [Nitrospirota bacterium]